MVRTGVILQWNGLVRGLLNGSKKTRVSSVIRKRYFCYTDVLIRGSMFKKLRTEVAPRSKDSSSMRIAMRIGDFFISLKGQSKT